MKLPPPRGVLLCKPDNYDVAEAANPHTVNPDGSLQSVDTQLAIQQWQALRDAYEEIGLEVTEVPAVSGLPDQVFTANPVFCYPTQVGDSAFITSRMTYVSRQPEVEALERALTQNGASKADFSPSAKVEGGGDLLWKGDERMLLGGHGFRSDITSIKTAAEVIGAPVTTLQLVDDRFYHLDTCLAVLDSQTALWVPEAFDAPSQEKLKTIFATLLRIPMAEALTFAGNAHCPDGKNIIIDKANQKTIALVRACGFNVIELDTSEFRKSGGSVYCMKQVYW